MNMEQTVTLCRTVKACCPAQAFDRYTPDAWYVVLGDYDFEEAMTAVRVLASTLRFIAPADIIQEIKHMRNERARASQEAQLWDGVHHRQAEVRAGRRGAPPASLRETIAELRKQLSADG
jgi:hypothetical protein